MTSATDTGYYMSISEKLLSIPQKAAVGGLGGSLPIGPALPVSMGFRHEGLDRRILTILKDFPRQPATFHDQREEVTGDCSPAESFLSVCDWMRKPPVWLPVTSLICSRVRGTPSRKMQSIEGCGSRPALRPRCFPR